MNMEQLITVATFNDQTPATELAKRFEAAGIRAEVFDESLAQKYWFFTSEPRAHMRVRVDKENGERAEKLLQEWDAADGALRQAVRCPDCGSSRIEYPQFSRRAGLSFAFALIANTGLLTKRYNCRNCQFTWLDQADAEKKFAPPRL